MSLWDFCILVLAASALLDAWFNGSLFASLRLIMQLKADDWESPQSDATEDAAAPAADSPAPEEPPWLFRCLFACTPSWLGALLSCSFCSGYHAPWLLLAGCYVPSRFLPEPWSWLLLLPLYSLAATRLLQLLNGSLPPDLKLDRNKDV